MLQSVRSPQADAQASQLSNDAIARFQESYSCCDYLHQIGVNGDNLGRHFYRRQSSSTKHRTILSRFLSLCDRFFLYF
ncbi:MAG: hypothetical protein WBB28_19930 [Crinalium sp.]